MSIKRKAAVVGAVGMLASLAIPTTGLTSSHREAPLIAKDPSADNTDLYAFVSPDKPDTVTLIANYIPFQEPNGGPNFYPFDDNVLYEIKVDNDGDAKPDVTFGFRFNTTTANEKTFLYNTNTVSGADYKNLNVRQTYTLTMNGDEIGTDIPVPPANVGPRSTPNYEALAQSAVTKLDNGVTTFAGQRDDPFFVDVGAIFDLGGLRPFNDLHIAPLPKSAGIDSVGGFNVNTLAVQVPKKMLTNDGKTANDPKGSNAVIGIYASASRQTTSVLSAKDGVTFDGDFVQVSRLGNPLINEVVVPLGAKDLWNRSKPVDDKKFEGGALKPELAALINLLYPATANVDEKGREDLKLILLQGVPGLNSSGKNAPVADLLRLNMAIPPSRNPSRMGVLAGDLAGYPNGRRLWDDVTDIEIRAVAQGYGEFLNKNFGLPNKSPNNLLGDGCNHNDVPFLNAFPYVATPRSGYLHVNPGHHATCGGEMPPSDTVAAYRAAAVATPVSVLSASRYAL